MLQVASAYRSERAISTERLWKKAVITWREEMRVALATINKSTKRESPLLTFVRSCGRTEIVGKRGEPCVGRRLKLKNQN